MDKQLIELIKHWREGTENYAEQVGYARGSDFAFRKCADDLEKALARIDAERGKEAVGSVHRNPAGQVYVEWKEGTNVSTYVGQSFFLSPTIQEGMVLFGRTLDGNTMMPPGANKEGIALYAMIAAAQGERK